MLKKLAVIRREHFNAAHRLYNEQWSEEQNRTAFGKCSLPHYHGHNYELEIKVVGEVDPVTGFVMDLKVFMKSSSLEAKSKLFNLEYSQKNIPVKAANHTIAIIPISKLLFMVVT